MKKEEAFSLLSAAYNLSNKIAGEVKECSNCIGCSCETVESGERVTLLPYEAEYIECKLKEKEKQDFIPLINLMTEVEICPFLKDYKCSIHDIRPIDCRSYPIVPKYNGIDLSLVVSKVCPYWMKITKNEKFINLVEKIWAMLLPLLDKTWWEEYASQNQDPFNKLTQSNK